MYNYQRSVLLKSSPRQKVEPASLWIKLLCGVDGDLRRRVFEHAGTAWLSADRRHRGRFRQSSSCFDYFGRAFGERMSVRTDPPAKRWMRVSRSPITIAQQPCLFSSTLLLPFNLSSLFMSLFLQFRSPHPCSAEINPRSPTSVEREKIWWAAVAGWWQSAGCPSYTAAHTPTGHWAPQLQAPQPSAVYFSAFAAHLPFVSSFQLHANCSFLHKHVTMTCSALSFCLGSKAERSSSTSSSSFCAAPPMQCNQTQQAVGPYFWPLSLSLSAMFEEG